MLYRFDNFEMDTDKFELRRDGEAIHVEPQIFDFLHFLICHAERVVTREEVIDQVWGGRIVSDTTISSCVKAARKILGDDGEQQRFIKTARGRGFQFIAPVKTNIDRRTSSNKILPPSLTSQLNKSVALYAVIACLIFIIGLLVFNNYSSRATSSMRDDGSFRIAVMPFVDLSADGNQEYFGDGISEEVLNVLTSIDELNVTSRTTAFSLKGQNLSIPEIAEKLNVNYIVEGSVRSSGNRIRITAQLIETRTDSHLWAENYDRELDDIFAIQDDISEKIASALRVELIGGDDIRTTPTTNIEAYTLYLQGHQLFLNRGTGDIRKNINNLENAIELLEQAVTLDPNFAEAWADLATSNIILPSYFDKKYSFESVAPRATEATNKAISLKPTLSQAWAAKGFIHLNQLEFQEAEAAIVHATELNPNNETAWLWRGLHFASVGNHKEAEEAIKQAIAISPSVAIYHSALGMVMHATGNIEKAIPLMDKAIYEMGFEAGRLDRALISMWTGNSKQAIAEMIQFSKIYQQLSASEIEEKIKTYTNAYSDPSLKTQAGRLLDMDIAEGRENTYGLYMLQDGAKFKNDFENSPANKGFVLARIYTPLARPLFLQSEFKQFVKNTGLLTYWKNHSFPSFCRAEGLDDFSCDGSM